MKKLVLALWTTLTALLPAAADPWSHRHFKELEQRQWESRHYEQRCREERQPREWCEPRRDPRELERLRYEAREARHEARRAWDRYRDYRHARR